MPVQRQFAGWLRHKKTALMWWLMRVDKIYKVDMQHFKWWNSPLFSMPT
jgi:hypothetical protein